MQPRGIAYWEGLAKIINEEPVHEREPLGSVNFISKLLRIAKATG